RANLFPQRNWRYHRDQAGHEVRELGDQSGEGANIGLAGALGRGDVSAHRCGALSDRTQVMWTTCSASWRVHRAVKEAREKRKTACLTSERPATKCASTLTRLNRHTMLVTFAVR